MAINLYQSQVTLLLKFIHIDCSIIFFWNRQFLKRIVACRIAGNFLFFEKSSAFLNVLLCHKIVWHLIFALKSISFWSFAYLGTLLETRLFVKILLQAYLRSSLVYPVYYLPLYFRINHIFIARFPPRSAKHRNLLCVKFVQRCMKLGINQFLCHVIKSWWKEGLTIDDTSEQLGGLPQMRRYFHFPLSKERWWHPPFEKLACASLSKCITWAWGPYLNFPA